MDDLIPTVANKHTCMGQANDVSIMRPGPYGNPFQIGRDGTRAQVIAKHLSDWRWKLKRNPRALDPLMGKRLICCCAPLPCHGDNYVLLIKEILARRAVGAGAASGDKAPQEHRAGATTAAQGEGAVHPRRGGARVRQGN